MGSTHETSAEELGITGTIEKSDPSVKSKIRRFVREPTTSKLIGLIEQTEGRLTARFPSAEGHHYINCNQSDELIAVYVGPYGPEHRPKPISEGAIGQLLEHADDVSIHSTEETELGKEPLCSMVKNR